MEAGEMQKTNNQSKKKKKKVLRRCENVFILIIMF